MPRTDRLCATRLLQALTHLRKYLSHQEASTWQESCFLQRGARGDVGGIAAGSGFVAPLVADALQLLGQVAAIPADAPVDEDQVRIG